MVDKNHPFSKFRNYVINAKLVIAINYSIVRISQKSETDWNLRCNTYHIYGLN
jgi:hypothetical protein